MSDMPKKPPNYRRCLTLCNYSYPISEIIHHIKTHPFALGTNQLSVLLAKHISAAYARMEIPKIIIPMPSHPLKILSRGFNPSDLIAQILSNKLSGKLVLKNVCFRKHFGKPQRNKIRGQRMKILNSTFQTKQHSAI